MKRVSRFNDVRKYLDHRRNLIKNSLSLDWDDGWATDKNWLRQYDGFYSCKFCAQPMYAADYKQGEIIVSCRTPLCPGNINGEMQYKVDYKKYDIKKMTNQYLFDSMMKF